MHPIPYRSSEYDRPFTITVVGDTIIGNRHAQSFDLSMRRTNKFTKGIVITRGHKNVLK